MASGAKGHWFESSIAHDSSRMMHRLWLCAALVAVLGMDVAHAKPPLPPSLSARYCRPATPHETAPRLGATKLVTLCHEVYADPATTPAERRQLTLWYGEARAELERIFGAFVPVPVVFCTTDACELQFEGPARRARVVPGPALMVAVNGVNWLTRGTIVHELVHVETIRRLVPHAGARVPSWFSEGIATYFGDNVPCPNPRERAIDDLRRLSTEEAWQGFTSIAGKGQPAYCQARDEIAAWLAQRQRGNAVVEVLDAVANGGAFDAAYGALATAIPSAEHSKRLDAHFALDENRGTDAADTGSGSHIATLIKGAIWTTGKHGAAVKVMKGASVRADGLVGIAIPDAPFTVALWAKPLALANVLVHLAADTSGGNGFCVPLLGHDTSGRLVGQIGFAPEPRSFLAATGPSLPLHDWSHVAITWSAESGVRLFVNGKLAASAAPTTDAERHRDAPAVPLYLFFGSDNGGRCWSHAITAGDWNGAIDDLRVYDYAMTAEAIEAELAR